MKKRLLLMVGSALFASLLAEFMARLIFPEWAPRTALITDFWQYDPRYGWSHVPGASGKFKSFGIDTTITINRKGFRGPEIEYARSGVLNRVLVIGDSLVWGFGVDFKDMFTSQLETSLSNTEVVNLGVSGYSTDQELLLYQDEGHKYEPDVVTVVVAANDRSGNERTVEYLIYGKPKFVERNHKLELTNQPVAETFWVQRAVVWLAWRSFILGELYRYLYQAKSIQVQSPQGGVEPQDSSIKTLDGVVHKLSPRLVPWKMTILLLLELKLLTEKHGSQLLVAFGDGIGLPIVRDLAALLEDLAIDSLFLDQYLDRNDKSLYLPDMVHWSPLGNRIVATIVGDKLKQIMVHSSVQVTR
jgi:lysophospholipase L1-like esterase